MTVGKSLTSASVCVCACVYFSIELQVQEQPAEVRSAVYSHLEAFVPCNKEALLKRLKKLSLNIQVCGRDIILRRKMLLRQAGTRCSLLVISPLWKGDVNSTLHDFIGLMCNAGDSSHEPVVT